MSTKRCSKCKTYKPLDEFVKSVYTKDGYKSICRVCYRKDSRAYYHKNRVKMDAISKQWNKDNRDYINERRRAKWAGSPIPRQRASGRTREEALQHKDVYLREYYLDNREHYLRNAQVTKDRRNYMRRKRISNIPSVRIGVTYRTRLSKFIRKGDRAASLDLLGCTFSELQTWLEAKFLPGMTWNNYGKGIGKWNVDHIIPCASFDLTDPKQQSKCFHYSNLQPLWAVDNMRKGARLIIPSPISV